MRFITLYIEGYLPHKDMHITFAWFAKKDEENPPKVDEDRVYEILTTLPDFELEYVDDAMFGENHDMLVGVYRIVEPKKAAVIAVRDRVLNEMSEEVRVANRAIWTPHITYPDNIKCEIPVRIRVIGVEIQ